MMLIIKGPTEQQNTMSKMRVCRDGRVACCMFSACHCTRGLLAPLHPSVCQLPVLVNPQCMLLGELGHPSKTSVQTPLGQQNFSAHQRVVNPWCALISLLTSTLGNPRMTCDLLKLSPACQQPLNHTQPSRDISVHLQSDNMSTASLCTYRVPASVHTHAAC
jgi:hypothetical protein